MPFADIGTTKLLATQNKRRGYAEDLSGRRFGRWIALRLSPRRQNLRTLWVCRCECGAEREVITCHLKSGKSVSCGCYAAEVTSAVMRVHGHAGARETPEYKAWCQLINRCENTNGPDYRIYGARGIKVCPRWRGSFLAFLEDMGPRPSPSHSVERGNSNLGYEPSNCRWATKKEQANNTSRNRYVEVRGERMTLQQAVDRYGGVYGTVKWRLYQGQPIEQALRLS